jgi:hypothetical protein
MIQQQNLDIPLYLAVPLTAYGRLFSKQVVQATIQEISIRLIVVDIDREDVIQWIG